MNWKARLGFIAFGLLVMAQGIGNFRAHHYEYWNSSHKFIFYPETQIACGVILMVVAVLPLRRVINRLTGPYLKDRHANLRPFWKRRHQND